MDDILDTALAQLDQELIKRNLSMEIVICGAYVIRLLGYSRVEHTLDVDSITELVSSEVKQIKHWKSIKASIVSRADLIKMKASAFSIRRELTNKDWEDLVLLKPTSEEMDGAIRFVKDSNSPPPNASKKILADFEETLHDLKRITK